MGNKSVITFMLFTIAWVLLLGNAMEIGENMRFRFLIDPFTWILVVVVVHRLVRKLV